MGLAPHLFHTLGEASRQDMIYLCKIPRGTCHSLSGAWNKHVRCNKEQIDRGGKKVIYGISQHSVTGAARKLTEPLTLLHREPTNIHSILLQAEIMACFGKILPKSLKPAFFMEKSKRLSWQVWKIIISVSSDLCFPEGKFLHTAKHIQVPCTHRLGQEVNKNQLHSTSAHTSCKGKQDSCGHEVVKALLLTARARNEAQEGAGGGTFQKETAHLHLLGH